MSETKLTDEEIVKALENCNDGITDMNRHNCDVCPYKEIEPCGKAQMTDCLDLIHRLQEDIEFLKQEKQLAFDTVKGYSLTDIEQKAEIERLTSSVLKYAETLGNEQRKSAELKKQVDEYKAKLSNDCIVLYKEDAEAYRICEEKYGRPRYIDGCMTAYAHRLQTAEHLVQQAVKDTAKDYHDAVKELFNKWDCCGCVEDRSAEEWYKDNDKIAREQFGVEVD